MMPKSNANSVSTPKRWSLGLDARLGSKYASKPYMTYLSIFHKATNSKKKKFLKMYKQKTTNILTKYGLPIKSDLISRGKQGRSNNDSPPNHVL